MSFLQENAYWMALAHLPRWRTERVNRLVVDILHQHQITLAEFFEYSSSRWQQEFACSPKETEDLEQAAGNCRTMPFWLNHL